MLVSFFLSLVCQEKSLIPGMHYRCWQGVPLVVLCIVSLHIQVFRRYQLLVYFLGSSPLFLLVRNWYVKVLFASSKSGMYVCMSFFYKFLSILLRDSNDYMYSVANSWCTEALI